MRLHRFELTTIPLVRSDTPLPCCHQFESTVAAAGGPETAHFYGSNNIAAESFPRFPGSSFEWIVGSATNEARRQVAEIVWQDQFAEPFLAAQDVAGVQKSRLGMLQQTYERDMLALPLAKIAEGTMEPERVADFASLLLHKNTQMLANNLSLQYRERAGESERSASIRAHATWIAQYATAFQDAVKLRLQASPSLILDKVTESLVPFYEAALRAQEFTQKVLHNSGPIDNDHGGSYTWRHVGEIGAGGVLSPNKW